MQGEEKDLFLKSIDKQKTEIEEMNIFFNDGDLFKYVRNKQQIYKI